MIETFDYGILEYFQQIHSVFLTHFFRFFTVIGEGGALWIVAGILLLAVRKYRKYGVIVLFSLLLGLILGNGILKNVVARPRPCWRYPEVELLIAIPRDYSFPSGHTLSSFTAAISLLYWKRKAGVAALIVAALIAASRLYFFVHYPTDILAGIAVALVTACMSIWCVENVMRRRSPAGNGSK